AVFLALAVTAWALGGLPWDGRRLSSDLRRADWARVTLGAGVAVAAVVPVGLLNLLFPEGGEFPFRTGALILAVGAAVAAAVILPAEARTVRLAAVLFAVVAPLVYLVPNPLGGNLTRFALVAAPALVVAARPRTSHALLLGAPLLVWQLAPAFDAVAQADDPSLHAS